MMAMLSLFSGSMDSDERGPTLAAHGHLMFGAGRYLQPLLAAGVHDEPVRRPTAPDSRCSSCRPSAIATWRAARSPAAVLVFWRRAGARPSWLRFASPPTARRCSGWRSSSAAIATFLLLSPHRVWLSALFPGRGGSQQDGKRRQSASAADVWRHARGLLRGSGGAHLWRPSLVRTHGARVGPHARLAARRAGDCLPLVTLASRAIGLRRENLALVAQGK